MGGGATAATALAGRRGGDPKFERGAGGQLRFGNCRRTGAPVEQIFCPLADSVVGGDSGGVHGNAQGEKYRYEADRAGALDYEAVAPGRQPFDGEKREFVLSGVEEEERGAGCIREPLAAVIHGDECGAAETVAVVGEDEAVLIDACVRVGGK
jgi:hypothetical protein